jgi:hypothetical protein
LRDLRYTGSVAVFLVMFGVLGFLLAHAVHRYVSERRAELPQAPNLTLAAAMPPTAIADVSAGTLVRVVACVQMPPAPMHAPWTGRPCVAYSLYVENAEGRRLLELADVMPFLVADDAGTRALVRPGRDSIQFTYDANESSSFFHEGPSSFRDFLVRNGLPVDGLIAPLPYRCHEGVIEPGEEITIIGVARHELDPDAATRGYRDQPKRAVFSTHAGTPPTVIDGPARWHLR